MATFQLTAAQQRALEAEGDTLVSAAAGSGKTRVLTQRILRAVIEQNVPLRSIVAVTFTEKAAQEIRERVAHGLITLDRADLVAQLEQAWITTIHGLCARILRRYGARIGLDPGFLVLDAAQVAWLRQHAVAQALEAEGDDQMFSLRLRMTDERLSRWLVQLHEAAEQRVDRTLDFSTDGVGQAAQDMATLQRLHTHFQTAWKNACRAAGGVDFDDLQHLVLQLLAHEDVAVELRFGIQRLLVDEFQDTNEVQCAVLEQLGNGCTFAVGDEWQSIYRFRKADVAVFRRRAGELGDATISMRDNFRSRPSVLDVVNGAFGSAFGARYEPVVAGRAPTMDAAGGLGHDSAGPGHDSPGPPACEVVAVERVSKGTREGEAAVVAARVADLLDQGAQPGDIALLFARQTHAALFEAALAARGIRSLRSTSTGYWKQQQVEDVTSLLAWARNRADDRAAFSVLAAPWVGLEWADLLRLRKAGGSIWSAACVDTDPRCRLAVATVEEVARLAASGTLVDAVEHAVNGTGYLERVLAGPDGRRRVANMRKLVELAASAHRIGVDDLGRFLELVAAQRAAASEGEASIADESAGAVRILTIHASKGLEFPYVFVCDTTNAGRRTSPELLVSPEGRVAAMHVDADGRTQDPPPLLEALRGHELQEAAHEERRLFYVALTRACERLWISGSFLRDKAGVPKVTGALAWLAESLDVDLSTVAEPAWHATLPLQVEVVSAVEAAGLVESVGGSAADVPAGGDAPVETLPSVWGETAVHAVGAGPGATLPSDQERPTYAELVARHAPVEAGRGSAADRAAGTALHRSLAELLEHAVRLESGGEHDGATIAAMVHSVVAIEHRAAIHEVVASVTFAELVAAGARAEVPFIQADPAGGEDLSAGRFDVLARDGTAWWIVDYKRSLPRGRGAALELHHAQLERYAGAARAAGARHVRLTLLPIDRPDQPHEWQVTFSDDAEHEPLEFRDFDVALVGD